jgi:hypothetical protein
VPAMLGRSRSEVWRLIDLDRRVLFGFAHIRSVPRSAKLHPWQFTNSGAHPIVGSRAMFPALELGRP